MLRQGHSFPSSRAPIPVLLAALVLAAVLAGGATERMPEGFVLGAMGAMMIAAPPAVWPDRKWCVAVAALLAVAATGLLPAAWFHAAPWRAAVAGVGIVLPPTLSPQPRLTVEAWLLLAAGIAWMGWLMAYPWDDGTRRLAARSFTVGALVLSAFALVQWKTGWRPPGWLSVEGHGPFPNRNHTAHVLALGGVLAVGCAVDSARRGWKRSIHWILAAGVVLAALAATYSRGGVVMFFCALGIWNSTVAWTRKSWKILLLGLSALCVAGAAVLVFGGAIAERFAGGKGSEFGFRFKIWTDAVALTEASPVFGSGLGNFDALFPFFRTHSVIQSAVIHPESDWLWLASETGLVGAALGLTAVGIALAGAFPLRRGTQRRLRGAALAAAFAAALHGFVDVPGHRLGSVLAALFALALARKDAVPAAASRMASVAWRGTGLAIVLLAAWWITFTDEASRAEALSGEGRFAEAARCADRAIARAPLDWHPYFTRAGALACSGKVIEAVADFRRARLLEPHFVKIPFEEGRFWLRRQPALALSAWTEALNRSPGPEASATFGQMLWIAPNDPVFRRRLLEITGDDDELKIDWFLAVPPDEAKAHLSEIALLAERSDSRRREAFLRRAAELVKPAAH